jgi:hypothetical protein
VLALGQHFVAFGIHHEAGQPYYSPSGETPLDVPFDEVLIVAEAPCRGLLGAVPASKPARRVPRKSQPATKAPTGPVRDADERTRRFAPPARGFRAADMSDLHSFVSGSTRHSRPATALCRVRPCSRPG